MSHSDEFFPVPRAVVGRTDLSAGAVICLGALHAYDRKGRSWPSVAQLTDDLRAPRRTVTRWLAELSNTGLATSVADGRETLYAPSTCAKNGVRRDLDPAPEHAPKMAYVAERDRTDVAHVPTGHTPGMAHVAQIAPLSGSEREDKERTRTDAREVQASSERRDRRADTSALSITPKPAPEAVSRMRRFADAYAAAYKGATGRVWLATSALDAIERGAPSLAHRSHEEHLIAIVAWLEAQPDDQQTAVLRGAFADDWMRGAGFPLASIAKDPGRFTMPIARKAAPDKVAGTGREPAVAAQIRAHSEAMELAKAEWAPPPLDIASMLKSMPS